jgi:exopolysaccharide production protein ExoQ
MKKLVRYFGYNKKNILITLVYFTWIISLRRFDSPQTNISENVSYIYVLSTYIAINFIIISQLIKRYKHCLKIVKYNKTITLIYCITILSTLWSVDPYTTFISSAKLTTSLLFAIYFVSYNKMKIGFINISIVLIIIAIFSIVVIAILPNVGKYPFGSHVGQWRGIFFSKNAFGSFLVYLSICTYYLYNIKYFNKKSLILSLVIIIFLLVKSSAMTSVVLAVLLPYFIMLWYLVKERKGEYYLSIFISLIFVVLFFYTLSSNIETITGLVGRDATLTGRIPLWIVLIDLARDNIFLGYGYGAFWEGSGSKSTYLFNILGWKTVNAHNSFLHVMLDVGIFTAMLILLYYIKNIKNIFKYIQTYKSMDSLVIYLIIAVNTILFFTEAIVLEINQLNWNLFLISTIYLNLRIKNK